MGVRTPDPPRLPKHVPAKNAPGLIFPNRDTPKTRPVLGANLRRCYFRGVCNTPLHGYTQKIVWFHISAHGCTKNPPDFTLPNRDTPKSCPVLGANPCRRIFGGVCNTPLHGCVQNPPGFIFSHPNTPKTHPISPFPIRIRPKPALFYTQILGEGHFGAYAIRPYTDT